MVRSSVTTRWTSATGAAVLFGLPPAHALCLFVCVCISAASLIFSAHFWCWRSSLGVVDRRRHLAHFCTEVSLDERGLSFLLQICHPVNPCLSCLLPSPPPWCGHGAVIFASYSRKWVPCRLEHRLCQAPLHCFALTACTPRFPSHILFAGPPSPVRLIPVAFLLTHTPSSSNFKQIWHSIAKAGHLMVCLVLG